MLDAAQKIFSLRGRIARADAECIPFRTSMADLVLCSVSLGYFGDLDRVFLEFARALKPGGYIAISDLHPDALSTGWSRSFKLDEQRYELQHYRRSLHEITSAACGADLQPKLHRDVYFGAAEAPIFQRAGKQELFSSLLATPALFIGLWEKPCC
jgi:ubiquinone/menaquinone biosynthesis C-methylase UbiE